MSSHYCYIIRRREFVGQPIYKIGRTTEQGLKRLLQYDNGIGFEIYGMRRVTNAYKAEEEIKHVFDVQFENMLDLIGSKESYRGDIREMLKSYHDICDRYNRELSNEEMYELYEIYGSETLDDKLLHTLLRRYYDQPSEFTFNETVTILDMIDEIDDVDYGRLLGDDTELNFTKNHAKRAKYIICQLDGKECLL